MHKVECVDKKTIINLTSDEHANFKAYCSLMKTSMSFEIRRYVQKCIKEALSQENASKDSKP